MRIRAAVARGTRMLAKPWRVVRARGALASARRLHLGCGPNVLPGWTNVDLDGGPGSVVWNLKWPLPVAAGALDFVYSEHFIEHLTRDQAARLIGDCFRMLKPGGVLRLSTPDLAYLVEMYRRKNTTEWADVGWVSPTACSLLNDGMRLWGHQFVYDWEELSALVAGQGFGQVRRAEWHRSGHADLCGLECRPYHNDLILEAVRG